MKFIKNVIIFLLFISYSSVISQSGSAYLISSKINDCTDYKELSRIQNRIIELNFANDTLNAIVGLVDNCSFKNNAIINIVKDTISVINQADVEEFTDCKCYYELQFEIYTNSKQSFKIKFNNKELFQSNSIYLPAEYFQGELLYDNNAFHYSWDYYETGQIKTIKIRKTNYGEVIHFYESGKIKSNTQTFMDFDFQIIKRWDENGNLIEYENSIIDDYINLKLKKD
jgi:hypothetical protein